MNQDQQIDYRQQLGLKKILYKYENQNQQLRSQIKALNQRLQWILNKPKTPQTQPKLNPIQQYQGQILKQQMGKLYKQITQQSVEMKINKDAIDERHEQKCMQLENKIVKEEKQIKELNYKLQKYEQINDGVKLNDMFNSSQQGSTIHPGSPNTKMDTLLFMQSNSKTVRSGTVRVQNYLQKLSSLKEQTETVRKAIKDLEHQRDSNDRNIAKKHLIQTDFKEINRTLETGGKLQSVVEENQQVKKKGVWGMENTKENYDFVKNELQKLKKQKDTVLETIRNQNIVLGNKLNELQAQLQSVNNSIDIPPIPYQKRPLKIPVDLSISTKIETPLLQRKSLKPIDLGPTEFQRKNDKNFAPKNSRKVQWESTKNNSGIPWNDSQAKSPITGLNLWFDGYLLGLQILHELGSSGQQMQVLGGNKIIPIQYRLGTGDYLENVILYISQGLIHGIELFSKNGRADKFGSILKARKFDFAIKKPQKPVISFGQYRINNNVSEITKLGFQII